MSSAVNPSAACTSTSAGWSQMLEAAFDRCSLSLYRYFLVRVGSDRDLADDLMQQLWIHTQNLTDTPTDEVEYRLRAIARNLIRTHWRKQAQRPPHTPLADPRLAAALAERLVTEELPSDVLENEEVRHQLLLALTALPADEQELIVEHYFGGRSHAELAARHGLTPRAIEGRLYRARRALREKLQHLEPF